MEDVYLIVAVLVGVALIFLVYLLIKKEGENKSNYLIGFLALLGVILIAFPVFSTIQIQYGDLYVKFQRLEKMITEYKESTNTKIAIVSDSLAVAKTKINTLQHKLVQKNILLRSDLSSTPIH